MGKRETTVCCGTWPEGSDLLIVCSPTMVTPWYGATRQVPGIKYIIECIVRGWVHYEHGWQAGTDVV